MKKTTTVAVVAGDDVLQALRESFPQQEGFTRTFLPRLTFKSQNVFEGTGKNMKVVTEAGTFIEERESDDLDENGKKMWNKTELGLSIEGTIIYTRKQLRMYDEATEEYTSSPIYDGSEEVIPLFCNKKEIARGTPKALKAMYEYEKDGKKRSKLEDNVILYVLREGEVFQLNLRGTSMYSFSSYVRSTLVPSVLTTFFSEECEHGSIKWNKMMFKPDRSLTNDEALDVLKRVTEIKRGIADEKAFFADAGQTAVALVGEADDDF